MELKGPLAHSPKAGENGPDDGEVGRSLFLMQCAISVFSLFTFMKRCAVLEINFRQLKT